MSDTLRPAGSPCTRIWCVALTPEDDALYCKVHGSHPDFLAKKLPRFYNGNLQYLAEAKAKELKLQTETERA